MRLQQMVQKILVVLVMAAILVGCSTPTTAPIATAMPTTGQQATVDQQPTLNALGTQVAQTMVVDLTKNAPTETPVTPTATDEPTATPAPTNTPMPPTALPTATYIPWTATPLYTNTPVNNACSITSVEPLSTTILLKKADFDGKWVVKNIGAQTWETSAVDIVYKSGTKLQKLYDIEDLKTTVPYNSSLTVIVDMTAPADAGTYSTVWAIVRGSTTICTLNLTITVGDK